MTIGLVQSPAPQTLTYRLLVRRMHIERISLIGRHCHSGIRDGFHQSELTVTEPGPGRTVQTGQLHEVERHLRILPIASPTIHQETEELFVSIHIVGIRFTLIPDHSLDRILLQRQDTALVEIAWLVWMTTEMSSIIGEIPGSPASYPILDKVIVQPVSQDSRELGFQGISIYPGFRRSTADGIADQSYRHLQTIPQHLTIIISYGRKLGCCFRRNLLPGSRLEILQMIQRIQTGCRPSHIISLPSSLHIEKTEIRVISLSDVFLAGSSLIQSECHIRLSRTQPDLTYSHMAELFLLLASLNGQRIIGAHLQRLQGDIPLATVVGNSRSFLSGNANHHLLARIGDAMDIERHIALQYHIICIEIGQLKSTIISGNTAINGFRQDAGTFRIRMDGIRQQIRIRIERCMEIDHFRSAHLCYHLDSLLYFIMPLLGTRDKTGMAVGYRSHASQNKTYLRIHGTQRVHQGKIIFHELITIVRPVSWVRIVDTQVDDSNIALERHCLSVLFLLHVRTVSMPQQGSTRLTEVTYQVLVAQHLLKLYRIREMFSILNTCTIGNTVTNTSHLYFWGSFFLWDCIHSLEPHQECRQHNRSQHSTRKL